MSPSLLVFASIVLLLACICFFRIPIGMLLTAAYILWTMQRVYLGKAKPEYAGFADCNRWEIISPAALAAVAIVFGVFPSVVINIFSTSTEIFLELFKNLR